MNYTKIILYSLFGIYNLILFAFVLWFLLFAETYLNWFFIPDSFRWNPDKTLIVNPISLYILGSFILLIESLILQTLVYFLNRWYSKNVIKVINAHSIALWTGIILFIITVVLYSLVFYKSQ